MQVGHWGRGLYFAKEPSYSHLFATDARVKAADSTFLEDEKEVLTRA